MITLSEKENQNVQPPGTIEPIEPKKAEDYYGTFDTSIIYEYKDQPDIINGRCDNCGNAQFKSSVKNYVYIRECRRCGMKKNI